MKKLISEYLRYKYQLNLQQVVSFFNSGKLKLKVNDIPIKNISYEVKEGDVLEMSGQKHIISWTPEGKKGNNTNE